MTAISSAAEVRRLLVQLDAATARNAELEREVLDCHAFIASCQLQIAELEADVMDVHEVLVQWSAMQLRLGECQAELSALRPLAVLGERALKEGWVT